MNVMESIDINERFSFLDNLKVAAATNAGRYQVRFAIDDAEVAAAQALRYRVFYDEKQGNPSAEMIAVKRDIDEWDAAGFHVIVIDTAADMQPAIVGTLRLFFNECLQPDQHFYTEKTFSLSKLHNFYGKSLELSRFCVDPNGRGGVILMLIWKYAMSFLQDNDIDVMFGCASFTGVNIDTHLPILNYLYDHHLAPELLRPVPKVDNYIDLNTINKSDAMTADAKKAIPTLLRGYLKLGAKISDAAIIDPVFNTVYVAIYVETKNMLQQNPKLLMHV
jgi:putative hemolysin